MAEQAINTVYALGERPDLLCSSLIKNLTRRVFARKCNPLAACQEPKEKDPDATHFLTQIPQPIHKNSEMKAILSLDLTSIQSLPGHIVSHYLAGLETPVPILTTGHD